jgi:hypothetical protein
MQVPKPIEAKPSRRQVALKIISSPLFEEVTNLATRKFDGLFPAGRQFEKAPSLGVGETGDRPSTNPATSAIPNHPAKKSTTPVSKLYIAPAILIAPFDSISVRYVPNSRLMHRGKKIAMRSLRQRLPVSRAVSSGLSYRRL